jgi:hypothetical protein
MGGVLRPRVSFAERRECGKRSKSRCPVGAEGIGNVESRLAPALSRTLPQAPEGINATTPWRDGKHWRVFRRYRTQNGGQFSMR